MYAVMTVARIMRLQSLSSTLAAFDRRWLFAKAARERESRALTDVGLL